MHSTKRLVGVRADPLHNFAAGVGFKPFGSLPQVLLLQWMHTCSCFFFLGRMPAAA